MYSKIVIVGGGAGGLELACKLGRKLGPGDVALVDSQLYHIWKPSLHEVAAGTLDIHREGLSYQMLAHDNGFTFVYGPLTGFDAEARTIDVGAIVSGVADEEIVPQRRLGFASLVLAIGSTSNHFGIPGAEEHTISLSATEDAERFRLSLLKLLTHVELRKPTQPDAGVDVVIIGAGATGVELAAELREASSAYASYGLRRVDPVKDVRITLLEGAPRILAPLPECVADAALKQLARRHISVMTGTRVAKIEAHQVSFADGTVHRSDLCVWAAGIQGPALLARLGLSTTRSGQVEVDGKLAVKGLSHVYALGDCPACVGADGIPVPPRAQAAHQQADYLLKHLLLQEAGKQLQEQPYRYRDYGSLVSFAPGTSVGNLMGSLKGFSWFVEGYVARLLYVSLHLMHHRAVLGGIRTGVLTVARFLIKKNTPLVKLH